jgi:hypothetical protein
MYKISPLRPLHKIIRTDESQTCKVGNITGRSENIKDHTPGISEDKWQMYDSYKTCSEDYEADKEVEDGGS